MRRWQESEECRFCRSIISGCAGVREHMQSHLRDKSPDPDDGLYKCLYHGCQYATETEEGRQKHHLDDHENVDIKASSHVEPDPADQTKPVVSWLQWVPLDCEFVDASGKRKGKFVQESRDTKRRKKNAAQAQRPFTSTDTVTRAPHNAAPDPPRGGAPPSTSSSPQDTTAASVRQTEVEQQPRIPCVLDEIPGVEEPIPPYPSPHARYDIPMELLFFASASSDFSLERSGLWREDLTDRSNRPIPAPDEIDTLADLFSFTLSLDTVTRPIAAESSPPPTDQKPALHSEDSPSETDVSDTARSGPFKFRLLFGEQPNIPRLGYPAVFPPCPAQSGRRGISDPRLSVGCKGSRRAKKLLKRGKTLPSLSQ
ncbi:unnamed protein product [Somion occarium]|uniref:C2H2-type domain-containing protein n=1 Tax=Somion occarium TaxID=3059160 RepID=A0ABP1CRN4_9APHY